jgi:hypothetical protein
VKNRDFLRDAIIDMMELVSLKDLQKVYWIVSSFAKKRE